MTEEQVKNKYKYQIKLNAIKLNKKITSCQALNCNFNFNNSCFYNLNGHKATYKFYLIFFNNKIIFSSSWKISKKPVGNKYYGIYRSNPNDLKLSKLYR